MSPLLVKISQYQSSIGFFSFVQQFFWEHSQSLLLYVQYLPHNKHLQWIEKLISLVYLLSYPKSPVLPNVPKSVFAPFLNSFHVSSWKFQTDSYFLCMFKFSLIWEEIP